MAARRTSSVCLSCQSRQSLIGRRRIAFRGRRGLETVAVRPEDDGFIPSKEPGEGQDEGPVMPVKDTVRQWKLHSPVDEIREALLGFDALYQRRDLRLEVLRNLSNPWPSTPTGRSHPDRSRKDKLQLPEAKAAPVPHDVFRRNIQLALNDKEIRKILRVQLLRCEWPSEILRIMAVTMQHKVVAQNFAIQAEPILRALYRCRNNATDPQILRVLNIILWRLKMADLRINPALIQIGLRFAARSRSLQAMKKYLRLMRESGSHMTSNVFRSIIAKFSIGHRGLGEIRNGRWKRDQLLQVLNGFDDAKDLPPDQQYHLGSFLDREDWQYLHGWVAALARCRDCEGVWREWEFWKQSVARTRPKKLESQDSGMTSRVRGDYWFAEQMTLAGDYAKAWQIVSETNLPFQTLKQRVKSRLLEGLEYATVWNDVMREELLRKYDTDLAKMEKAFGVQWVPGPDGAGMHELVRDQEQALEELSASDWKLEEDFGFPYSDDEEAIGPASEERALHDAEEKGFADE